MEARYVEFHVCWSRNIQLRRENGPLDQLDLDDTDFNNIRALKLATDHSLTRDFAKDYALAHGTGSEYKLRQLAMQISGKSRLWNEIRGACTTDTAMTTGVDVQRIQCCPAGHIAYTGAYKDLLECPAPKCGLKRYAENDKGEPISLPS